MASVEHFEIPADDIARASAFYREVFGFGYEPWGEEMGMIRTGSTSGGIDGDLHLRSTAPHPTIVITVDRIEDTIALIVANGGEQVGGIEPLGPDSRWVYVRDSEGNLIGLFDKIAAGTAGTETTAG